jgi:predicted nucleic acid-binding protein
LSTFVVDVNVAIKWHVAEDLVAEARSLLSNEDNVLIAPYFLVVEAHNVYATKVRSGDIDPIDVQNNLAAVQTLLELIPDEALFGAAFTLATTHERSFYDSLYVALALREACQLVTADKRLFNSLKGAYPETILWLGDVQA